VFHNLQTGRWLAWLAAYLVALSDNSTWSHTPPSATLYLHPLHPHCCNSAHRNSTCANRFLPNTQHKKHQQTAISVLEGALKVLKNVPKLDHDVTWLRLKSESGHQPMHAHSRACNSSQSIALRMPCDRHFPQWLTCDCVYILHICAGQMLRVHSPDGSIFLWNDVMAAILKVRCHIRNHYYLINICCCCWNLIRQLMFKINRAKFHPDLIWNDGALGFFEEDTQQEEQEEEQQQDNLKNNFWVSPITKWIYDAECTL